MTTPIRKEKKPGPLEQLQTSNRPLTARAVADLCGVELKTVHNWALEERLEYFRTPGRHLRFQPAAVVRFLDDCGYETPLKAASQTALVVTSSRAQHWTVALADYRLERATEVYCALIAAGRVRPNVIVLDTKLVDAAVLRRFEQACEKELPDTQLVFVAARLPASVSSMTRTNTAARVRWATPSSLAQVAQPH